MNTQELTCRLSTLQPLFIARDWAGLRREGALEWIAEWCVHGWPALATRHLPDPEEAHSCLVAHVWTRLDAASTDFPWERGAHLVGWLCCVARRKIIDHQRRLSRTIGWERADDNLPCAVHEPYLDAVAAEESGAASVILQQTETMLAITDPVAGDALRLRLIGCLNIESALGLTQAQVKYRLRVARGALRSSVNVRGTVGLGHGPRRVRLRSATEHPVR